MCNRFLWQTLGMVCITFPVQVDVNYCTFCNTGEVTSMDNWDLEARLRMKSAVLHHA